ncbi:MAG: PucR family transcriptional regulator [Thermoleophilia bacterium]
MAGGRLTVADLLREDGLELTLVAGHSGRGARIRGVHISEIPDPTPWLSPGDLLLTTGLAVHDDAEAQESLIRRLADKGISALGLAVGLYLDETPPAMRETADEVGLPLFEVPFEIPLKSVTGLIFNSLQDRRFYQLRRSLTVQDHLLDLVLEDRGAEYLVSSVAMLLSTSVIVFGVAGEVVARADARVKIRGPLQEEIWAAYRQRGCCMEPAGLEIGEVRVYLAEVRLSGRVEQILCLVYPRSEPVGESATLVAKYVQKLLALELARRREEVLVKTRMRASMLDDLLSGFTAGDETEARLVRFGFDLAEDARLLVCDIDDFSQQVASQAAGRDEERIQEIKTEFRDRVDAFLTDLRVPFLSMGKSDSVIILAQLGEKEADVLGAAARLRGYLLEQPPHLRTTVGISDGFRLPSGVPGAFVQAREAVRAYDSQRVGPVRLFSRLGPSLRVLDGRDPRWLGRVAEDLLAPLMEYDRDRDERLVATLETYLESDRKVNEAARDLFVHPNTLRNRLRRIERILGLDLSRTDTIVDLALALRCLKAAREAPGRTEGREGQTV